VLPDARLARKEPEIPVVVAISPKFRIVIRREIRDGMGLKPGQKMQAFVYQNRLELIPVRTLKSMRGFLRGINTAVRRDRV
jgi:AbrB family looped-hinge helix DNA binding protein